LFKKPVVRNELPPADAVAADPRVRDGVPERFSPLTSGKEVDTVSSPVKSQAASVFSITIPETATFWVLAPPPLIEMFPENGPPVVPARRTKIWVDARVLPVGDKVSEVENPKVEEVEISNPVGDATLTLPERFEPEAKKDWVEDGTDWGVEK
jgi:hypothetical protein